MRNLDSILKNRDITLPKKVHLVKAMVFSSSHVWMWELDYKEVAHAPLCCALCPKIVLMLCLHHNSWEILSLLSVLLSDKTSPLIQLVNENENNNVSEKVLGEKCYLDKKYLFRKKKKIHLTPMCVKCTFTAFLSRCTDRRKTQRGKQSTHFEWPKL